MKKSDQHKLERAHLALAKAIKLLGEVDDSLKAEIAPDLTRLYERRAVINAHGNAEQAFDYLNLLLYPNPEPRL